MRKAPVMKPHGKFAGIVSALLAVSTLATTVPAQAQEGPQRGERRTSENRQYRPGTPEWQGRQGGAPITQAPVTATPQGNAAPQRGWNGDGNRERWNGERRDASRGDWNRGRDDNRPRWDGNRDRGEWQRDRDRDRQVWNRDRDRNDNRRWDDNGRRWDRDDRRDWNDGRFDSRRRWADQRRWDQDWRRDNRYDWQRYRSYNRDIYRMPRYYAPYGWNQGYRSFSIGVVLSNGLYGRNYWISDPGYYRLPPAYGTLRWVRYYDDALLVDVRDGYVVDVIRNFFW